MMFPEKWADITVAPVQGFVGELTKHINIVIKYKHVSFNYVWF